MTKNRLPKGYRDNSDYSRFERVLPFAERLIEFQESLITSSKNVAFIEPDISEAKQHEIEEEYKLLASFTGLLAQAAQKLDAEVSETGAAFRHYPALSPMLRNQLQGGMDKMLLEEIGGNYNDGDKADFAKQIEAFVAELRGQYDLSPRQR